MSKVRSVMFVVGAFCVGPTLSVGQKPSSELSGKPEELVAQVERDWLAGDAKGDAASLRRIISDDFMGGSFDGGLLNKEGILPEDWGPGGFAGATPGETNVRVFGDTGVLMGYINIGGGAQSNKIRVTLVCQKRPEGWQIIAAQLTR